MPRIENKDALPDDFLKSLGFPTIAVHQTFSHFDFTLPGRRILVIGPMGSGKTEFSARVWRDAAIAQKKSDVIRRLTSTGSVDRRKVFFIRSEIDGARFTDYPPDALAYRSGYVRCGENIARIRDSFGLEQVLSDHPDVGTFIIDEASFFDERIAYVVRNHSEERGILFIFPTLILNFRRDIFNSTARLMLDIATDVIPLTAYCEHSDCMKDAFYTYRYYQVDGQECPALYFDPLIIVGGDTRKEDPLSPNYCSRCDEHHYLPGKEYTFFYLKPLGEKAARGNESPLFEELKALHSDVASSALYSNISDRYGKRADAHIYLNSLKSGCLAEKALIHLFCEQNLLPEEVLVRTAYALELDIGYMEKVLQDNRRPVSFEQPPLKLLD
ncbi:MAG: thymidine kinase [Sphaerochaetaceae bacterium]|mgnify:CR=1 FL=1|jgi:thymidine kinase|nr:thymidine kinase [Sphaerochaetaceae bacterium]NLO59553.1 thymidine kinase [Spirochaetales bacterium]MDD2405664.1 thymidine kinase [Sphaerochaetaceae bacterium]MDD3671059.1 thymidine kinase [Sphaerochaetaceae bacterium]MDD4258406.1 thymidine kinase [Sphaerochaetaceae bacterium]